MKGRGGLHRYIVGSLGKRGIVTVAPITPHLPTPRSLLRGFDDVTPPTPTRATTALQTPREACAGDAPMPALAFHDRASTLSAELPAVSLPCSYCALTPYARLPPFRAHVPHSSRSMQRVFADECRLPVQAVGSGVLRGGRGDGGGIGSPTHARLEDQPMHLGITLPACQTAS